MSETVDGAASAIASLMGDDTEAFEARPEEETELEVSEESEDLDAAEPTSDEEAEESEEEETADDEPDEDEQEAEEETAATLDEIAEALEVPMEEFLANQKLTFNAAGETVTATLAELQESYQKEADFRKKSMALADERKGFAAEREQRDQEYQATSQGLAQSFQFLEGMISSRLESPEMQSLRETDPAEWSARVNETNRVLQNLHGVRQQAAQEYISRFEENQKAYLREQGKILENDIPDWGEEKLTHAIETIKGFGFSDEEIPKIGDARLIKGALRFKELEDEVTTLRARLESGEKAAKKVKKLPQKPLKPSSGKAPANNRLTKIKSRLRKTPRGRENLTLAAKGIEELL